MKQLRLGLSKRYLFQTARLPVVHNGMTNVSKSASGDYLRDGNPYQMVGRFSAQLHIPGEQRYSVEDNHADMMKLAEGDLTYQTVVMHIKNTLESIRFQGGS
jgi:hypothetical protein